MTARLFQFRRSPYNEKARWALDLARVPHERVSLLPGPHVFTLLFKTVGTLTPTLERDGRAIVGSNAVVLDLVARGESALLPADATTREEALAIVRRFDEDFTPRIRRATLHCLLADADAWHETFASDATEGEQARYRRMLPLFAPVIRLKNGMSTRGVEDGRRAIGEALAFVEDTLGGRDTLLGAGLSLADVTAASALAMVVPVDHPEAAYGPKGRAAITAVASELEGHARATQWVCDRYARDRPTP